MAYSYDRRSKRAAAAVEIRRPSDIMRAYRGLPKNPKLIWKVFAGDLDLDDVFTHGSRFSIGDHAYFGDHVFESLGGSNEKLPDGSMASVMSLKFIGWR